MRTIYRDVQTLGEAGIPVYAERRAGRRRGHSADVSAEQIDGQRRRKAGYARRFAGARFHRRIRPGDAGQTERFFRQQADGLGAHRLLRIGAAARDGLIPALKAAILNLQRLTFDYYNSSGVCAPREVCPIRLWFKSSAWYLLAYCMQKRALRTFKLTRIKRLCAIPGEFPDEALACAQIEPTDIQPDTPPVRFTLRIDASMAFRVYDDFEEEQLTRMKSGDFLVQAAFMPGEWLISFILSYGAHAKVVEPKALADAVRRELEKISALYKT